MSDLGLKLALSLLDQHPDWYLFPLRAGSKVPAIPSAHPAGTGCLGECGHLGHGLWDATNRPDVLHRLFEAAGGRAELNVGIDTGRSGLYVVDIDTGHGKDGMSTWRGHLAVHGSTPTLWQRTRNGGCQLFYASGGQQLPNTSAKALGHGIDTRGHGGYVVAPGSVVPADDGVDGPGRYDLMGDAEIAPLPEWIAAAVRPATRRQLVLDPFAAPAVAPFTSFAAATPVDPAPLFAVMDDLREPITGAPADGAEALAHLRELLTDAFRAAWDGSTGIADAVYSIGVRAGGQVAAGQHGPIEAEAVWNEVADQAEAAGWTWTGARPRDSYDRQFANGLEKGSGEPRPWLAAPKATSGAEGAQAGPQGPTEGKKRKPKTPEEEERDYAFTEVRLADRLAPVLADDYRYAPGVGWLHWDGVRWAPTQEDLARERLSEIVKEQYTEACQAAINSMDTELPRRLLSLLKVAKLSNILHLAQAKEPVRISTDRLDADPDLLNTASGIVDLRTGELGPHDRDRYMTKVCNAAYRPGARHKAWDAALEAVPAGALRFLQTFIGQAATGHTNTEGRILFAFGGGENGKGTTLNDGVLAVLGDYGVLVSDKVLMGDSGDHPTYLMSLRGARLALLDETPEARTLNVQRVKRIIDQPQIRARLMREDEVTFATTHTLVIATNYPPLIREQDHGTWRRLLALVWPYRYMKPSEEITDPATQRRGDPGIKQALRSKAGREAILAWIVEGAMAWYAQERRQDELPDDIVRDTAAWRVGNDPVISWFEENLVFSREHHVLGTELLSSLNEHLEGQGAKAWSATLLGSRLAAHPVLGKGLQTGVKVRAGSSGVNGQLSRRPQWGGPGQSLPPLGGAYRAIVGVRWRREDEVSGDVLSAPEGNVIQLRQQP